MEVKLLTPREYLGVMEDTAALAYLTCHANADKPYIPQEKLQRVIKAGHESILEHITLTYSVKGISRAVLQELSRHRHISLSVESTRHTLRKNGKITAPFGGSKEIIDMSTAFLEIALSNPDMPNDELKYFLPEFWPTNLILTSNIRELRHILTLRTSPAALNEFRVLAYSLFEAVPESFRYLLEDCVYRDNGHE